MTEETPPPNPPEPPPPPPPEPPEDDLSKWDAERAKATILSQRESERALKAQLAEANKFRASLEKEKEDRALAEMTEIDRLKKETEDAKAALLRKDEEIKEMQLRAMVSSVALKLNIVDLEVAFLLLDKADLTTEDKVEAALKDLLKAKPYLAAAPKGDDGKGKGVPETPKPNAKGVTAEQTREAQDRTAAAYRGQF